jgi:hypothetical protein
VTFHQPTTAGLQPYALEKAIKLEVENLFGDYGYGAITGSINGKLLHPENLKTNSKKMNINQWV